MPIISIKGDTNVHGGAPFDTGLSTSVNAGNLPIALANQTTSSQNDSEYNARSARQHNAGNQLANAGSPTVFANNLAVHRIGDARIDGATAGPGAPTVIVN